MPTKDELSTPYNACVTRFVKLTLHFECLVQQVLERLLISVAQESHALVHLGGTQHVAETDVLEAKHVSHIVVVWQVTKRKVSGSLVLTLEWLQRLTCQLECRKWQMQRLRVR